MPKDYIQIGYRDIAKLLAKHLPVEGEEFASKVEDYLKVIKALPQHQKTALKVAFVFASKVPREEREDFFQDIALTLFKAKTTEERLAYAIARCDWKDWWRAYKIRQHTSLDSVITDTEGNAITLAETLVGEVEFETKVNGKMDAERIYDRLPDAIKPLVVKRLIGKALTNVERAQMSYFVKTHGTQILLQTQLAS